jgi:hypothetical protein
MFSCSIFIGFGIKIIPPRKRGGMIFYMALLRGVEEPQIALPAGYESSTQAKSKINYST